VLDVDGIIPAHGGVVPTPNSVAIHAANALVQQIDFGAEPLVRNDRLNPVLLFVAPEALPNERLPALARHTVDGVVRECEELLRAGVNAVILFGIPGEKDEQGFYAKGRYGSYRLAFGPNWYVTSELP
jgi:delta-aminolevulinic acid dehydratase/porphobilinogen synthase